MKSQATIRPERPNDIAAIASLTEAAFRDHPHSSHTESLITDALRRSGVLTLSLVAELDGKVVGHIAFSPVTISDGATDWYGLGPVAVVPVLQGQGIGSALVEHGLEALRTLGAHGCVLLGEPEFYTRFGFQHRAELILEGVPPEYFLSLAIGHEAACGNVTYHESFNVSS